MKELKGQIVSALLVVLTVAAAIAAFINFQQQKRFHLPEDGVTWVDRTAPDGRPMVLALDIEPASPAERSGLRTGDLLERINGVPIQKAVEITQVLFRMGAWTKADYYIRRDGVEVKTSVIVSGRNPGSAIYYQYAVGLAYLGIGLFVYFRRGSAPKSRHFFALCLASFVFSSFHYTGKLNNFDMVIYWGNVAAGLFAPTIFLHFCLVFPEPWGWFRNRASRALLYLPATLMLLLFAGVATGTLRIAVPLLELRWMLDRLWLPFLSGAYLLGGLVLTLHYRRVEDSVVRQQLKWLRNGAVLGVLPFTLLYVLPYSLGTTPGPFMDLAVLSLPLIPLTWAWAIVRYRLMDVDVIFQQGYVYTLATLAVLGIFYGLVFSLGKIDDLNPSAVAILIAIATFVFQPIRNWIQEQLDRYYFYKDRYDYRLTLIEFARELSSETDIDAMLASVADRLRRTLSIGRVSFFLSDEDAEPAGSRFRLHLTVGRRGADSLAEPDLSFLSASPDKPYLFFERTRHNLDVVSRDWPVSVRRAIADLDLTYYIPCTVRGRTIAWLGLSRTDKGDFLSSDDVELLVTLSGSVGIAVENARLYRSLQRKVEEYERLKEFSENIVESINVGILAADLDDRVESWNNQIERLTGIAREDAVGRRLADLLPAELVERFDQVRGNTGIHHIYKFPLRSTPVALATAAAHAPNGNGAGVKSNGAPPPREAVLNVAIAPLVAKDMAQIGRLIIFDDITDRSELERRLVQADKLSSIGLLAAGVAHEVNTPLAVISTYAQMLAKQVGGDDQKSQMLEKIARQTFRASEIVNSLLNFSRTSTTEMGEVDLNRVIRDTFSLLGHQLERARVAVSLDLEETLGPVRGNAGKLQQVFLNLLLNARDAMEGGGTISIHTRTDGDIARVGVADTGQGIPSDHLARIFDPFFTTKMGRKGTGLGLSVTYGIVQEHGGVIEVDSRPGAGTRFRLEFPLARKPIHA